METASLLSKTQVQECTEELRRMEAMLQAPAHISSRISDRREMRRRYQTLKKDLETSAPRPYSLSEKDLALREFATLEDEIREGMPDSEEMRRNPPGAVSKHEAWNKRVKKKVLRFKHIARRLEAGGDIPSRLQHEGDIANIERLRPVPTHRQLAMDGAQIPKTRDIHIGSDPANAVYFTDKELAVIATAAPAVAATLAILPADQRAGIKEMAKKYLIAMEGGFKRKPKPQTPYLSEMTQLRMVARANGIIVYGKSRKWIEQALEARNIPLPGKGAPAPAQDAAQPEG